MFVYLVRRGTTPIGVIVAGTLAQAVELCHQKDASADYSITCEGSAESPCSVYWYEPH